MAFSLKFQKFFLITITIFSHTRSEQIWKQNTISFSVQLLAASHTGNFVDGKDEREKISESNWIEQNQTFFRQ